MFALQYAKVLIISIEMNRSLSSITSLLLCGTFWFSRGM